MIIFFNKLLERKHFRGLPKPFEMKKLAFSPFLRHFIWIYSKNSS